MQTSRDLYHDYQSRQHRRYREFLAVGQTSAAQDALWRAASAANLLRPNETSTDALTPDRVAELIAQLGFNVGGQG